MTEAQIDTHLKQIDNLNIFDGMELCKLFSRSQSNDVEKLRKTLGLRSRIKTPFNLFIAVFTNCLKIVLYFFHCTLKMTDSMETDKLILCPN